MTMTLDDNEIKDCLSIIKKNNRGVLAGDLEDVEAMLNVRHDLPASVLCVGYVGAQRVLAKGREQLLGRIATITKKLDHARFYLRHGTGITVPRTGIIDERIEQYIVSLVDEAEANCVELRAETRRLMGRE